MHTLSFLLHSVLPLVDLDMKMTCTCVRKHTMCSVCVLAALCCVKASLMEPELQLSAPCGVFNLSCKEAHITGFWGIKLHL